MKLFRNVVWMVASVVIIIFLIYIYNFQEFVRISWGNIDERIGGTTFTNCFGLKVQNNVVFGKCFIKSSSVHPRY